MYFVMLIIKACERQWREDKTMLYIAHHDPCCLQSGKNEILNTHREHETKEVMFLTENMMNFYCTVSQ